MRSPERIRLLAQLQHVNDALDEGAARLRGDPWIGGFFDPRLRSAEPARADLIALGVASAPPLAATEAYVARVREVGRSWPVGLVAHHYVRYLDDRPGVRARDPRLQREYCSRLDDLLLDRIEEEAFIAEVFRALTYEAALVRDVASAASPQGRSRARSLALSAANWRGRSAATCRVVSARN